MRRISVGVWLCCGMVAILLLLMLRPCESAQRGVDEVAQPEEAVAGSPGGGGGTRRSSASRSGAAEKAGEASDAAATAATAATAADAAVESDEAPLTPAELAIAEWHLLLDSLCETEEISDEVTEMQPRVYAAFIALSAKDRPEAITHAMNLLPDDALGAVYGILFDPAQPAEVLNIIFDDVLNRDERIKNPVIRAIADDPDHPLAGDAAKIFAVVGDEHE